MIVIKSIEVEKLQLLKRVIRFEKMFEMSYIDSPYNNEILLHSDFMSRKDEFYTLSVVVDFLRDNIKLECEVYIQYTH